MEAWRRVSAVLIRVRYVSLLVALVSLAWLLVFGRRVDYEQSLTAFFPEGDPNVVAYQRASALFGNDNFVFIGYDDPNLLTPDGMDRLKELAAAVGPDRVPAVTAVDSLDATPQFWRLDDELVRLEALPALLRTGASAAMRALVQSGASLTIGAAVQHAAPGAFEGLRARITGHPLLRGVLVSEEGTSTVVVAHLKSMEEQDVKATIAALRAAADRFTARHGLGPAALVGPPVLLADGFTMIEIDGRRLAFTGMALIGLVTLTATRSLWWALVPLLAGWVVWLAAEHVLGSIGLKLSLSSGPLVAQIIVLTMPAASHLAIHFRDDLRRAIDRVAAARETLASVTAPVLWCAVTGALGYAALITSNVVPVRQFGSVLCVCTLAGSLLTLVLSPIAMCPFFPLELPVRPGSTSRTSQGARGVVAWVARHPLAIVSVVSLIVLPLLVGMPRLRFESNYINAFKPDSRVVRDYRFIESRLGGIGLISLVVPVGGEIDMATVERFRALDLEVRQAGRVSGVLSLGTVLDPEGRLAALPGEQADHALRTKLDLIAASPQGALLGSFWNPEEGQARVMVRVPEQQPAPDKEATFRAALGRARSRFGPESFVTGLSYLLTQTTRGVMKTSWSTFVWAVVAILGMLALAYRRPSLAVLALLPSLLAVGFVLGLMGWLDVPLDIATALVASVALGLSVDDTFHCLLQYLAHRRRDEPFQSSLLASYAVSGPGVVLSSLAVAIGFAVLWFSEFVPFAHFGMMVGIATLGSSIGNLVLLPACLSLGARYDARTRT